MNRGHYNGEEIMYKNGFLEEYKPEYADDFFALTAEERDAYLVRASHLTTNAYINDVDTFELAHMIAHYEHKNK